jgi:hypothetical protein
VLQQVKPWPYQLPERGANTLVAGRLLPESMKAASRTTIQ